MLTVAALAQWMEMLLGLVLLKCSPEFILAFYGYKNVLAILFVTDFEKVVNNIVFASSVLVDDVLRAA